MPGFVSAHRWLCALPLLAALTLILAFPAAAQEGSTRQYVVAGTSGTGLLLRSGPGFNQAKRFAIIGATMGFLVWFFGFMVVGGEWFAMWQSQTWNGQDAAFKFYVAILGVLIYVNQPDGDLVR